ncbi:MAG TPA: hypothetical protein VMT86_16440, partial [Bryobacteraceae bacterium]|nr:hypothetical protein [Bryobacteraceae bacterium]
MFKGPIICLLCLTAAAAAGPQSILVDYPKDGTVFPPDFAPPTFLWRDPNPAATHWAISVEFRAGGARLRMQSAGERMQPGEIDPRCVGAVPPKLTPEEAVAHTWNPDARTWATIKTRPANGSATITITGLTDRGQTVSRGSVSIETSKDPVGAPIFYRDVPLIPSPTVKGVIKPLPSFAIGLIAWRLRNVSETSSRKLMDGLPTCVNCHSFALDGKTLGLDVDGPQND